MIRKQLLIAAAALLSTTAARAAGDQWTNDFSAATEKAAKEGKDLLIDFTGSDWCGWCIKLKEEVFQHEAFKEGVADDYVLVELDFPRSDEALAKLSDETKAQNQRLQQKYQVQGFPTILLTDPQGRPYAKTGYQEGGPEAYLDHLASLQKNKAARDAAFAAAEEKEGVSKAEALFEGLQEVPEDYRLHYEGVITTIKENDPEDSTGLIAAQKMQEAMMELEKRLQFAMQNQQAGRAMSLVDEFIAEYDPKGEEKQKLLAIKLNVLYNQEDFTGMEKVIDEIIAVDPDSRYGQQLSAFKESQLQELKKKAEEGKEDSKE